VGGMNIIEKVDLIKSGKLSAEKNILDFLNKIKNENLKFNAVLSVNENALEEAKEIDKKKEKGKLAGIGFLVKACICVKGLECNCASKTLEGWKAPYDSTVVKKIKDEDGVVLGITNMDEFACGGSGETSAFGACQNPSALGLIPGGSSSGSAASVVAGFCDVALGSDTGGSIRNPASHCGVVGVKPSYGLVSRYGLIDLSMSLDQIGPLTKDVESVAYVLNIIKGRDEKDSISIESDEIKIKDVGKIKIGVMKSVSDESVEKIINNKIESAIKKYGWDKKEIEIKYIDLAIQTYYPLVYVEFFSGTRKFDGRRFGKVIEESCGPEVLRRILGGSEISKAEYDGRYYKKSLQVKELIKKEFAKAFEKVDCIITPTVPRIPHKIGSNISVEEMYSYDSLTIPANLAEICGVSIPAGFVEGVPVGMQILGAWKNESKMLSIAKKIQELN
jgi:aspartyl-tRNA(Asn)/glutamyl-tRNA(Gln) amidotransferase subunit A